MVDKNIEQDIHTAVSHATPDVLDKIYASCEEQKGTVTYMNNNQLNRKRKWIGSLVAAAALVLVGISGFAANRWNINNTVNSKVILDVNPSISLNVNAKERVLSVEPRNDEGKKIIGDMDLKNTDIDVAVNALIGSMLQNGYLSDMQNAILVSVENDDAVKGSNLQVKLTKVIEQMLKNSQFESVVFGQTVNPNQSIKELSSQYNVSEGKAALINELIQQDEKLTFEGLAQLSVHEIALIMESKGIETKEITKTGHASYKAYIGKEEAKAIAYAHAKVDSKQVKLEEIEFDTDDGIILYEIEFKVGTTEYEYDIHAITGKVLQSESETKESKKASKNNISPIPTKSPISYLSEAKVKELVFKHAGIDAEKVKELEIELDDDDDDDDERAIYKIEFKVGKTEYEYKVDAVTGNIIKSYVETND